MTASDVRTAVPAAAPRPERRAPTGQRWRDRWSRVDVFSKQIAAITAGGAVLRFAFLGRQPLSRDEAFTVLAVHKPLGALLSIIAHDSAPPLSYIVQHAIVAVWGGNAGLRALSALAGTAAIPIAAALGRRLGGQRVALWCAATVAVFPSMVLASRDARMYSLATTLVLASTLAVWRLVERPTWGRTAGYALCTAAALGTNYFTAFAVAGQLLTVVLILRAPVVARTRATVAATAAAFPMLPWLVYARAQFAHGSGPFWVHGVGASTVSGVGIQFFAGPSVDPGIPAYGWLVALQAGAVVLGVGALVALAARWRSAPAARRGVAFLAGCSLGGMAMLLLVSVWHPLVEARYASVMWGPLVVVVGAGLAAIPWRTVAVASAAGLGAAAVVLSFALTQPDTPTLARELNARVARGDLVVASPAAYLLLLHYGDAATRRETHIVARSVPWYWGTAIFPPRAVLHHYPPSPGTVFYVDVPGQPDALRPPTTYERDGPRRCDSTICLSVYRPVSL
ncbi:MAG TPA: glycosyltransferase family 39 protein, partial [Acidimicrobiia bacterium]|nr:glycosyltransferase family 39 protein [Acidimicrobiia bacterium]